jgi:spore maturation protein CgeB
MRIGERGFRAQAAPALCVHGVDLQRQAHGHRQDRPETRGEVRGAPGTWLYGRDLAKYVQETKVIVGDNYRNDVPGYWSTRNYVIPGAGGFLLTSRVPGLEKDFEIGTHIAVYDTPGELEEAIALCIAHDAEREEMRRVGFVHVRANHDWKARARVLLETLRIKIPK